MSRAVPLLLFSTGLCALAAIQPKPAHAATIPDYFFKAWTVNRDCTEQHAGVNGRHTNPTAQFRVARTSADGSTYSLVPLDKAGAKWNAAWKSVKLEYRSGVQMRNVPADMECVPGQESSSPFLAQSGFASSAEPYYGYEHWYGTVSIHGQSHHLLIFPRSVPGASSAVVMLIDTDATGKLQLDHNGTIIVDD
jgi:hypothetical protein